MTDPSLVKSIIFNEGNLDAVCLDDIQQYFWTRSIEFSNDPSSPIDAEIQSGTGTLLNVNCQIETLSKTDRSLFILCAKPQEDWNFGTCFPLMPGESEPGSSPGTFLLRFITLQDPIWIYIYSSSEIDKQTLSIELNKLHLWNQWSIQKNLTLSTEKGLYQWGGLSKDLPGLQELTDFIDTDLSSFPLQARVTFPDGFPVITLQLPLGVDGCRFGSSTLTKAAIEFFSPLYFSPNNSQISLLGTMHLGEVGDIDIDINFPLDSDLITATGIYSYREKIPFVDASALSGLPSLQPKEAVKLELELQFSKREKTLRKVDFSIDLEEWDVIENILTLKQLSFSFSVFDPLDSKMVIASIAAEASLGKKNPINLVCSGYYPSNQISLSLDSSTTIKIKDLIAELEAESDEIPDLEIDDLSAKFDLNTHDFSILVDVSGVWKIIEEVELDHLRFQISGRSSYSCKVLAEFLIAGVKLRLEANYSNESWQFEGSTGYGQAIPIGDLIKDLENKFGRVFLPKFLEGLIIRDLRISLNTKTKDFTFTCKSKFHIDDEKELDITIIINLTHHNNIFEKSFGGHIAIGELQFDLKFVQEQDVEHTSKTFVATYKHQNKKKQNLGELIKAVSSDQILYDILNEIEIDLKDVFFAYSNSGVEINANEKSETKILFGLDIGTEISLSQLPLVGKEFPPEQTVGVDDLQLLIASQNFTSQDITIFNNLIPENVTKIPEPVTTGSDSTTENQTEIALPKGLNVAAQMQFGGTIDILSLPISSATQATPSASSASPASTITATSDNATWFKLQKSFGPVYFERIGVQYKDAAIWFLLDTAFSAAGLTLSLEGLSVGSPLSEFEPEFNLQGLGIDYQGGGAVEIGGAFLKGKITIEGKEYDDYSGTATIRTETLTLAAVGSYVQLDVGPSMFVYAVLDYPIGGPAFFFVTGLAAGFGYNRLLHVPPVEQIDTFPLVQEAMGKLTGTPNLADELAKLQPYIPPSVGNYFLAIGIRFTSFKMIDSFILVSATFGDRFELDVVGLSTLVLPVPEVGKEVTPIAEVQLALRASFIPDDGFFGINAQLTNNSFLLDRQCHLTGGFAFYTWFTGKHEGDFVLTVGGYHPNFSVPSHYPTVPRLSFNWQVNDQLTFKGSAYYALTPSALMAGCSLSATWQDGDLEAWFDAGLNFLITWKPYHYEADFHISVGASYTFDTFFFGTQHISASVGADVSIWGPDFAGTAHISWYIISFTISFGASGRNQLNPIPWVQFRDSFLPKDDSICTINLKAGLIERQGVKDSNDAQQKDSNDLGIVNSKTLCLTTDSVIPMQRAYLGTQGQTELDHTGATTAFNIGTMQIFNDKIISTQRIIITRDGKSAETEFDFQPLTKNAPTALWGSRLQPSLQGEQVVSNLLTGYEVRTKRPTEAPHTAPIKYTALQQAATLESVNSAFQWAQLIPFVAQPSNDQEARTEINNKITSTLNNSDVASKRAAIANALFDDIALDLNGLKADDFLSVPQVKELTPA